MNSKVPDSYIFSGLSPFRFTIMENIKIAICRAITILGTCFAFLVLSIAFWLLLIIPLWIWIAVSVILGVLSLTLTNYYRLGSEHILQNMKSITSVMDERRSITESAFPERFYRENKKLLDEQIRLVKLVRESLEKLVHVHVHKFGYTLSHTHLSEKELEKVRFVYRELVKELYLNLKHQRRSIEIMRDMNKLFRYEEKRIPIDLLKKMQAELEILYERTIILIEELSRLGGE